jgi:hypothetical protein
MQDASVALSATEHGRWEPNASDCRVEVAGLNRNVLFCMVDGARGCRYALRFGSSYLCLRTPPTLNGLNPLTRPVGQTC